MADKNLLFDIFAVDRASKVFDKIGDHAEHMGSRTGKVGAFMTKALVGAAVGGVAVLGAAFAVGLKQAADYEKITAQTGAVLKSTGGAANVTAKHVEELAKSVESYSMFTDEAVQQGENLLLTFTNIQNKAGKGNDIFDQATRSLYDMAQALGEDPQKAAIQLGKALNDPIKGITALKRVGVSFTADQVKVIKKLVETGQTVKAQKLILGELNKEFGGSAKAAGETFAGSLERLKNGFLDMLRDAVIPLLPYLTQLVGWLADKLPAASKKLTQIIEAVKARFKESSGTAHGFANALSGLWGWITHQLVPALRNAANVVIPQLRSTFKSVSETIRSNHDTWVKLGNIARAIGVVITQALIPALAQVEKFLVWRLGPEFKVFAAILSHVLVPAIEFVAKIWLFQLGVMINAAAKLLGWVPGLGPKLKKAAAEFNTFARNVQNALSGIHDVDVKVNVHFNQVGVTNKLHALAGARASGGPMSAGKPYLVGENGPEVVVPGVSSFVVPNGGRGSSAASASGDFTASAPLILQLDSGVIWRGLVTMKRRKGNISLGLT